MSTPEDTSTNEIMKTNRYPARLIHLSQTNRDGEVLNPRVPDSRMEGEDGITSRVCFSSSVSGAIRALGEPSPDNLVYVHVPADTVSSLRPVRPTQRQVPDVKATREWWVCGPVRLRCIGRIHVNQLYNGQYRYVQTFAADPQKGQTPTWDEVRRRTDDPTASEIELLSKVMSSARHRPSVSLMKIRHLIQNHYGGLPDGRDWADTSRPIYTVYQDRRLDPTRLYVGKTCARTPISFRTREQARLFLSRPENRRLILAYLS